MKREAKNQNNNSAAQRSQKVLRKIDREFVERGAKGVTDLDVEKVVKKANDIQKKFSSTGPLGRFVKHAKLLLAMIKDYWRGEYREIPYWAVAAAVFSLLYVLSPADLIPDIIPVVGLLDDAAVVSVCLLLIEQELTQYEDWKASRS